MTVREIKEEILKLSLEERAELNRLLYGWEDDAWDKQMSADIESGRLEEVLARAEADMQAGRFRTLS